MSVKFPFEITPVDENINNQLLRYFQGRKTGFVQVGPKQWTMPHKYAQHASNYYNFELREDDLWIVTYPRSGTTLCQELLWLINNDLDYETAKKLPLIERVPFFEFNLITDDEFLKEVAEMNGNSVQAMAEIQKRNTPGYEFGNQMKSPRHFKTHIPLSLLPPNLLNTCKVVYIARNPFDVSHSFYHHNRKFRAHDFKGDFQKYWEFFENDLVIYTPYWQHIKEGWENKENQNLFFMFYEDLIKNKEGYIRKVSKFLNKQMSDDDVNKLVHHIDYDNFQKNVPLMRTTNIVGFVNREIKEPTARGKIGGKEEFQNNAVLKKRVQDWVKKNSSQLGGDFPVTGFDNIHS